MSKNFLENLKKKSGNKSVTLMSEDNSLAEPKSWIDTGNIALNSLLSANPKKGIPDNRVIQIAGKSKSGKTFLALSIIKNAIKKNNYSIVYFDTENVLSNDMLLKRGIDPECVLHYPVSTVEEFTKISSDICNNVKEYNENNEEKKKVFFVLDSVGNLSTHKEISEIENGTGKKDMTRAAGLKALFRVLQMKISELHIPMILINHTYSSQSMYSTTEISGGSGPAYFSSITLVISKAKVKEGTDVIGYELKVKNDKNRFSKEDSIIKLFLDLRSGGGLHPFFGLHEIENSPIQKASKGYTIVDGENIIKIPSKKALMDTKDWRKFDPNIIDKFIEPVKQEFQYPDLVDDIDFDLDINNQEEE